MSIPAYLRLVGVAVGMVLLPGLPSCSFVVHGFRARFVVSGGVELVTFRIRIGMFVVPVQVHKEICLTVHSKKYDK